MITLNSEFGLWNSLIIASLVSLYPSSSSVIPSKATGVAPNRVLLEIPRSARKSLNNSIVFIHVKTVNGYLIYATADKYAYLVKLIPIKGDEEYARICAEELCELLNDDPHKLRKHDK